MIYITGDTYRNFERIFSFCEENGTTADDVVDSQEGPVRVMYQDFEELGGIGTVETKRS